VSPEPEIVSRRSWQEPRDVLPGWLLARSGATPAGAVAPAARVSARGRSFLEKFARTLGEFLAFGFAGDDVAARPGLLQRVDPRVKLVSLLAFVVVSVLVTQSGVLLALLVVAVALALASRISLGLFAVRAWIFVPVFTAIVALPAITNWVTPGDAVLTVWSGGSPQAGPFGLPGSLTITVPGLQVAARLVLRATDAVSFAVLLTLTTRWDQLLRALRVIRVPRMFVVVLAMAYRYVHLLVRLAGEMALARRSRTVGRATAAEDRRFLGAAAATLFGKAQATSEQVYGAMVARGYRGETYTLERWRLTWIDLVWGIVTTAALAALVAAELFLAGTL
jgi:cobalt/nickel transport system permease protein